MASLAGLLSGNPGLGFNFRMGRARFDTRRLDRKYKEGRNRALDRAGVIVRNSAKKQFSVRQPLRRPIWKRVGVHNGMPLVSMSFQNTAPGKVTSWRPKRFLYSRIRYHRDDRRGSVVIGPDNKVVDVNTLQERGGSKGVKLVLVRPVPVTRLFQYKVPSSLLERRRDRRGRFLRMEAYVGMWHSTGSRVRGQVVARDAGRVPAGRYMEKGLQARRSAIAPQFKNQIHGP
jgi:ribosomal protein S13